MRALYRSVAIALVSILSVLPAHAALGPDSIPAAFDELLKNQNLSNPAMILIDGTTGAIVYEKNAYSQRKPASVMKILTGAVVLEHLDPLSAFSTTVSINPELKTVIVRGSYDPWMSLDHNTARKMNRSSLPYIGFRTMTYVKDFNGGSLKNYKVIYSGLYSQDVKNLKAFWLNVISSR
jgi:serine-type D-Ala-D-Ala carboxypeptidase/endopeptidase (penicillin-binding protein 4)